MATRKSVASLPPAEISALQDAFVTLKNERHAISGRSTYDEYVVLHQKSMDHSTLTGGDSLSYQMRNSAHRGPGFLPWHRSFITRLERDLQRVADDANLGLPYWDWTVDAVAVNAAQDAGTAIPKLSIEDLVGPAGTPLVFGGQTRYVVQSGPFGFDLSNVGDPANWWAVNERGQNDFPLERRYAANWPGPAADRPRLPIDDHVTHAVDGVLALTDYDTAPFDASSASSFRNVLEGWVAPGLHNVVHGWVGGSMSPGTSPNDPIFFLHHCNIDRIWAAWQVGKTINDYVPQAGGPSGHNRNDLMYPWNGIDSWDGDTPESVWDYTADLGFDYDALPTLQVPPPPPTP
jgi:tyrosinase